MTTDLLLAFALGYLFGSIPFGLLLTRFAGKGDLRDIGSGNIGATNVLRTGSKKLAAATLILDCLKATTAILVARAIWPDSDIAAAAGALIGHLYPVWLKFRGGKGVATLLGVLIALSWQAAVVFAIAWVGLFLLLRFSSVGGIGAAISAPITAFVLGRQDLVPLFAGFALLVVWKHNENIRRLIAGTEPKVGRRKT